MKNMLVAAAAVLTFAAGPTAAELRFGVVAEDGALPAGVQVQVNGVAVGAGSDGRYRVGTAADVYVVDIDAPGYYAVRHTLDARDVAARPDPGNIELVQRTAGRRLLLFAGDAMLARRYFEPRAGEAVLVRAGHVVEDGDRLLATIRRYVELADYASVNVETQLSDAELDQPLPKSVTFWSPAGLATILKTAGFDYAALGNNHTWDYRDAGLAATFAALGDAGLEYSGAGWNATEARRPLETRIDGAPLALLSYVGWAGTFTPSQVAEADKGGPALGTPEAIREDVTRARQFGPVVVQQHAGLEYAAAPALTERTSLRGAVEAGASVVIGHHPHVLQGIEFHDDGVIAYSMGNFLFDQYHYTTQLSMLLYVWLDGDRVHRVEAVPLNIAGYRPVPATGRFRDAVLNRLARVSAPFGTCFRSNGAHAVAESGRACETLPLAPPPTDGAPMPLTSFGADPLRAVGIAPQARRYRIGIDKLPRGDFESARLAGNDDRSWIGGPGIRIVDGDDRYMRIEVAAGQRLRAGMKVFERVFTASNPATLGGRIRVEGDARVQLFLQRRREGEGLEAELANGPLTPIGEVAGSGDWQEFAFDFNHPRLSTRSLRIVIDVSAPDDAAAAVELDDLVWVEWQTPWLATKSAHFGTHIGWDRHDR